MFTTLPFFFRTSESSLEPVSMVNTRLPSGIVVSSALRSVVLPELVAPATTIDTP